MSLRLQQLETAPDFATKDVFGNPVSIRDYRGSLLLLSFYRYVTCPLCHLRVNQILRRYPEYEDRLEFLAVFESEAAHVRSFIYDRRRPPFPIIADPKAELYRLYRVELSWWKTSLVMLRIPTLVRALRGIDYPLRSSRAVGGSINRIPADFLIVADGKIEIAHYGRDASDHIPFGAIDPCLGRGTRARASVAPT